MFTHTNEDTKVGITNNLKRVCIMLLLVVFFLALISKILFSIVNTPPDVFPFNQDILISEGMNQTEVVSLLKERGVVRSSLFLHIRLIQLSEEKFIKAGIYRFADTLTTDEIAHALVNGTFRTPGLKFTVPEGFRVADVQKYLPTESLRAQFKVENFIQLEGYLFPDTYFITSTMSLNDVFSLLQEKMNDVLEPYAEEITQSGFTHKEILVLASIVEREANSAESMGYVSGILQNRLKVGMPLQVDATFDYILGKTSAELTEDDLRVDSPFNTYIHKRLPPSPIANPGLQAIKAVLYPIQSDYLYYLTGNDGKFYYARDFESHKKFKQLHLR